jgi:hypothetical protein
MAWPRAVGGWGVIGCGCGESTEIFKTRTAGNEGEGGPQKN